jgi:hypothetical protein
VSVAIEGLLQEDSYLVQVRAPEMALNPSMDINACMSV